MVHTPIGEIRLSKYWNIIVAFVMLLLIASPIDFIPDIIPIVGWVDDLVYILIAGGALFGGMRD